MSTNYLHALNCKQLISILKHVQYGHAHLSQKLDKREYKNLLSIGSLSNNQLEKLESDRQEKIGNVAVVVNTILTSCFGAWLGFNSFNNTPILSVGGFFIMMGGLSFGLMTGYLSYLFTYKQERLALKSQQLCNVKRVLTDIISHKRKANIQRIKAKIQRILSDMDLLTHDQQDVPVHILFENISQISLPTNNHVLSRLLEKLLANIQLNIGKLSTQKVDQEDNANDSYDQTDFLLNHSLTNATYIRTLTKSEDVTQHKIAKVHNWLRLNFSGVAVGLLPTFLGTFASMFVFLNGVPAFLNALNIELNFSLQTVNEIKLTSLITALLISFYFSYSHVHSNYKSYKRAKQLELSENKLAEMTNEMVQLTSQLNIWYKILYQLELIESVKESLTKITPIAKMQNKIREEYKQGPH